MCTVLDSFSVTLATAHTAMKTSSPQKQTLFRLHNVQTVISSTWAMEPGFK